MFSDTHFHFKMMVEERGINGLEVLQSLALRDCFFGLDIGTKAEDLQNRQSFIQKHLEEISVSDAVMAEKINKMIYFSAGIWPDVDSIKDRKAQIKLLEEQIQHSFEKTDKNGLKHQSIIAVGECGLDHHWNPSGCDGRCESDFDESVYLGERELFEMQLELAKKYSLPALIHSRDAFDDSLACIKNIGYHNGIIHCYSYGIEEARKFLDLGWYIAFGGGVTYTKKSKMQEMEELLKFVPEDRFLTETDAPYLAPVPFRGQPNTPVLVEQVFNFISKIRNVTPEKLSETVDKNIVRLFKL